MKLLTPSPSISSSSSSITTTTSSLDANMCTSRSATAGCLAGVLRRILCSRSLPTHPSDHITETNSAMCDKDQDSKVKEQNVEPTAAPSIVARLMGLDSLPEIKLVSPHKSSHSISRSRSMNSADCRVDVDTIHGQHRRVKSTLSFREMPTFLELENDNFIVLSFENGSESEEMRYEERKCEVSFGELKQRRREKCKNKENKAETNKKVLNEEKYNSNRISDEHCSSNGEFLTDNSLALKLDSSEKPCVSPEFVKRSKAINSREVYNYSAKPKKKKKKIATNRCLVKDTESDQCSSEESSPVSVLDFGQFVNDPEDTNSEAASRSPELNSRRKLSPELENCNHPSPCNDDSSDQKAKTTEGKGLKSRKKDCNNKNYLEMWSEVCRVTEAEIMASNWIHKVEDFEDVSADCGSQILDTLLGELVDQFLPVSCKF